MSRIVACAVGGCESPSVSRGLCNAHYKRFRRTGAPVKRKALPPTYPPCSVGDDECNGLGTVKGLCDRHYKRMHRTGRTDVARWVVAERFDAQVDRGGPIPAYRPDLGPCWIWKKPSGSGYGRLSLGAEGVERKSKYVQAHRWSYEWYVGPIPEGFDIDHLCRVRACVNPDHLEAVTHRENVLRGIGPSAIHAAQTHCIHGHEFTPENTKIRSDGGRRCLACLQRRR